MPILTASLPERRPSSSSIPSERPGNPQGNGAPSARHAPANHVIAMPGRGPALLAARQLGAAVAIADDQGRGSGAGALVRGGGAPHALDGADGSGPLLVAPHPGNAARRVAVSTLVSLGGAAGSSITLFGVWARPIATDTTFALASVIGVASMLLLGLWGLIGPAFTVAPPQNDPH